MRAERNPPLTPEQYARIDAREDKRGISYALSRAIELGERLDGPSSLDEKQAPALPGESVHYAPSGHVRDFRGDREVNIGPGGLVGTEEGRAGYAKVRDGILAESEAAYADRLEAMVKEGKLKKIEAAARLRSHRIRRGRT